MCICWSQSPSSSRLLLPLVTVNLFSISWLYFCFANKFVCIIFQDSTHKWYCMIFVFLFLTSLCMTICRSIHIIANGINSSFLWLSNVPLYIHATFLYPFISPWAFRLLPCPGCVNCAAMNIGVLVSFRIMVFPRYSLGVGLLGHMVALFYFFFRTLHAVLHGGCTNSHSHQQCRRVPSSPHLLKHLLSAGFWWWPFDQCEVIPHCSFDLHFSNN